jgi:hypothetical protein
MNEKPAHTGTVGLMVAQLKDRKRHLEKELELISVALEALMKAWTIDACLAKDDAIVNQMAREAQRQLSPPQPQQPPQTSHAAHVSPELRDLSYADAVERLLLKVRDRREVGTRTLILRLGVEGKKVLGKDPYRTLYRTLLKDERFVRINGKWALAEWFPPAAPPSLNAGEKLARDEDPKSKERVN